MSQAELQAMTQQTYFKGWESFVDDQMIERSRLVIQETLQSLITLGESATEDEQMPILQKCIERFNDLDAQQGFIETIERENICDVFEEIVAACGIKTESLADEWRDW